ncbi:hypothetical protein D9758_010653 [Tetrapyrgos nigripes]|uniref:Uncharacterized protein n=1 Tax=Tetrapyrgos nigripes TaxID=182062 RepID=A0A8H5LPB0_9AGAR|nr:hypothetical protein D9758_010653 [Tetrapyrgos nigripes]
MSQTPSNAHKDSRQIPSWHSPLQGRQPSLLENPGPFWTGTTGFVTASTAALAVSFDTNTIPQMATTTATITSTVISTATTTFTVDMNDTDATFTVMPTVIATITTHTLKIYPSTPLLVSVPSIRRFV